MARVEARAEDRVLRARGGEGDPAERGVAHRVQDVLRPVAHEAQARAEPRARLRVRFFRSLCRVSGVFRSLYSVSGVFMRLI